MNDDGEKVVRQTIRFMFGVACVSLVGVLAYYWYMHQDSTSLGYLVDVPAFLGMLSLPVTLFTTAGAGLLSFRLTKTSEKQMALLHERQGIDDLLDSCLSVLRAWTDKSAVGEDDKLLIVLPTPQFGAIEASRRNEDRRLAEKFESFAAQLRLCFKGAHSQNVTFATNCPIPGRSQDGLWQFLATVMTETERSKSLAKIYQGNIRCILDLVATQNSMVKLYLAQDIRVASVSCLGSKTEGVFVYREPDQQTPKFVTTTNPKAVQIMQQFVRSQISGGDCLSMTVSDESARASIEQELYTRLGPSSSGGVLPESSGVRESPGAPPKGASSGESTEADDTQRKNSA